MTGKHYSDIGDQIKDIIEDAVNSRDFDQLNRNITSSIQNVFDELNIQNNKSYKVSRDGKVIEIKTTTTQTQTQSFRDQDAEKRDFKAPAPRFIKNPPGAVSGPISVGIGIIGTGLFGLSTLLVLAVCALENMMVEGMIASLVIAPFLAASIAAIVSGAKKVGLVKRFKLYKQAIGDKTYMPINQIADYANLPVSKVTADLQKMISKKFFYDGHMDVKKTTLMLDAQSYSMYKDSEVSRQRIEEQKMLELEEKRKTQAIEEQKKAAEQAAKKALGVTCSDDPEYIKTMEEGRRYINEIRVANDALPEELVSEKLDKMEDLVTKIFAVLQRRPEQLPKLRKFMKYYMPTTLKLVTVYQELDAQSYGGENIDKSKQDILNTMDTINAAYQNLLDSFFEDAAMDVSSDISVLEMMFKQDGLTQGQFGE